MNTTFYNDIDKKACKWLRQLQLNKLIPKCDIECKSISNILGEEVRQYTRCHFFAGIAGWELAMQMIKWPNITTWSGSCPCQPFSTAGMQKGEQDERHLWPEFYRLIEYCKPPIVVGEQVAGKLGVRWLNRLRLDLEASGYAVGAANLCAAGYGLPHIRQRLFWAGVHVGHARSQSIQGSLQQWKSLRIQPRKTLPVYGNASISSRIRYNANTVPYLPNDVVSRPVDLVRCYGNAIVPKVAAHFLWSLLMSIPTI